MPIYVIRSYHNSSSSSLQKPSFTGKPPELDRGAVKGLSSQVDGYGLKPYAFPTGPCGPINQTDSRAPKTKAGLRSAVP
jgi:hypothetical protein